MDKAPLRGFLSKNPYPHPLTAGLFYREKMRAIHRVAPERVSEDGSPPRVLEVGGGRSGLASLLYPTARVTTLDLDAGLLGQGPGAGTSTFVCSDARSLPFPAGAFDAVTLFDVLEHIPEDSRAAAEALRVTRPGGWLLVSAPGSDWRYPYHAFMRRWCPPEGELMREWGHVRRGYAPGDLARLFGAPAVRSASFVNPVTAFFHDVGFSRLGTRRRRLLYALAAPATLAGYLLHRSSSPGTETAFAWRRP